MTKRLEEAFAEAAKLSSTQQDALAEWILDELASERSRGRALAESADALGRLADEALAEHRQGWTRLLTPESL